MNILVEFVPQIIFLIFLFGYLCILMFIKWTKYYAGAEDRKIHYFLVKCTIFLIVKNFFVCPQRLLPLDVHLRFSSPLLAWYCSSTTQLHLTVVKTTCILGRYDSIRFKPTLYYKYSRNI